MTTRLINLDALLKELEDWQADLQENNSLARARQLGVTDAIVIACQMPTVDAVPVSFIEKRIEQLKSHADYEFEENGGYAGGSQYRQWELECLLDAWMKRKEE